MTTQPAQGERPVLMVVDDQSDVRLLLRLTLRNTGFEVREFSNALTAFEAAVQDPPCIILLDVMMPGPPDGLEMCRRLRELAPLRDTRVILLSARGQTTDIEAGIRAGADAYLTKPFSPIELVHTIQQLTDGAASIRRR